MVVLLVFGNNNIVMSNSLDQKVKKLYAARSKREAELHAIHEDILHCINTQSRRMKNERLVTKWNETFMTVVDKNEDLIAFAGKTEDPSALVPSLESYLEAMTTKNDKIPSSAQNYINSADDKVSEFQEPRASIRSRLPSLMASSITSSQRKQDYVIAKMKREEIEKRNEAAIRLDKQKKQMELDYLEENNRKRLTEATLQEFELLDAVSKGKQPKTTASARSSLRIEKAVQDWMTFPFRTQFSYLTSLLPSHTPLCLISISSTLFRVIITEYTKLYVPLLLLSQICRISLWAKTLCQI